MSKYIYSNLTCNQLYTVYGELSKDGAPAVAKKQILVKGGHGVVDKDHIVTPKGVVTTVSDSDAKLLAESDMFKRHEDAGYITVEDKEHKAEDVSKGLEAKDKSAPKVAEDFKKAPTTSKVK